MLVVCVYKHELPKKRLMIKYRFCPNEVGLGGSTI